MAKAKPNENLTWKDFPRTKDKLAIVGFHEATRDKAPYDNPDYEIWGCNEEYRFDWLKREDRHFQLHPRWDFSRSNNLNDPNHFSWLQNKTGQCLFCKGSGRRADDATCSFCNNGVYTPPKERETVLVYMQKTHDDIPNSIKYPMAEVTAEFLPDAPYYTSTPAYMLGLALLMGYKEIELYGFDMGTTTEYHYQRANFEYWIGIAHGRGIKVTLPGSQILHGLLYGYENMRTGFRQQLEMRDFELNKQFNETKLKCTQLEAQLELISSLRGLEEVDFETMYKEKKLKLAHTEGILNFLNGTKTETKNLTSLYDSYFVAGTESGSEDGTNQEAYSQNEKHVYAKYVKDEKHAKS